MRLLGLHAVGFSVANGREHRRFLRRIEAHISAPERPWLLAKEPHLLGVRPGGIGGAGVVAVGLLRGLGMPFVW